MHVYPFCVFHDMPGIDDCVLILLGVLSAQVHILGTNVCGMLLFDVFVW